MPEIEITDTRPDRSKVKEHGPFECLLDRILVRQLPIDNPAGFAMSEKYKPQSYWGEVIAIGDSIVLGGVKWPLSDFVGVGDLVKFGVSVAENFSIDDPDLYIIRLQDCRGRRRVRA
jgi:co-chaperonin GroES (HSP10)